MGRVGGVPVEGKHWVAPKHIGHGAKVGACITHRPLKRIYRRRHRRPHQHVFHEVLGVVLASRGAQQRRSAKRARAAPAEVDTRDDGGAATAA